MKIYIGKNIRYLRKNRNFTQEDLSKILNVHSTQIGAYEKEKSFPRFEGLLTLANEFQVSLDDLVYSDLSQTGITNRVEEPEQSYNTDVTRLMLNRISELEREIRENAPELARRLNLEEE